MTVTDLPELIGGRWYSTTGTASRSRRSITTRVIDRARFCSFSRLINFQCFVVRSRIPDVMNISRMFFFILEKCFLKNYRDVFFWNKKKSRCTLLEERKLLFFEESSRLYRTLVILSHWVHLFSCLLLFIVLWKILKGNVNNIYVIITFSIMR